MTVIHIDPPYPFPHGVDLIIPASWRLMDAVDRGSYRVVEAADHVHARSGECVKNRWGPKCDTPATDEVDPAVEVARGRNSVLQGWVMELPLREQGTLLTGIRGCDVTPKMPLDSLPRQLTAYLRFLVLNPADEREVGIPGSFFQDQPPADWKASEVGHLPTHWYTHVMHGYEVVGYRRPSAAALDIYVRLAESLHLPTESKESMIRRLSEDRIASDTVVS